MKKQKIVMMGIAIALLMPWMVGAAIVKNSGFENGLDDWEIVEIGDKGGTGTSAHSAAGLTKYDNGDFSLLKSKRMFLNATDKRSYTATALVYEEDGTTPQRVAAKTWHFAVAVGNRVGSAPAKYRDSSSLDLVLGYLATDDDLSSFTALSTLSVPAEKINAAVAEGHYADYAVSAVIGADHAALGKQLAVRIHAYAPKGGYKKVSKFQTSIAYVRVSDRPMNQYRSPQAAVMPPMECIKVTDQATGFIVDRGVDAKPDKAGIVLYREVVLPEFEAGAFYRPYSGGMARGNRVEAVAFTSLADLQAYKPSNTREGHKLVKEGQFMLLEVKDGRYLALLPMTSEKVYGQFFVENGTLLLKTGNFGTDTVEGDIPLLIWSYGKSPYAATRSVWKQVIESGFVATDWRSNKEFPEMYGYLGWCSWEFYKKNINEKILVDAVHTLESTEAPLRWVIVDDGYFNLSKNLLNTLVPVQEKFPNGWKPITDLKTPEKIKWMGIWRHSGGAMGGISQGHSMEELKPYLAPIKGGGGKRKGKKNSIALLPNGTKEAATAFYEMYMRDAKENGFDFTKVDFQTRTFDLYKGTANPVRSMRAMNEALEEAAKKFDIPLLNCIAQPNVNSLQTKYSALTRSSTDYNQKNKDKNKCNTYQSFANHLWMGQTVWGDLDMFHTHDERDVQPMAIARAISGGPVYISDEPSKIVPEVLLPFAYEDGKLLRTAAPATLLPESFFIHPFRDDNVFRVIAPMEDGVAAIALFNFTESGKTLKSGFAARDYSHAGELLQPAEAWTQPEEGLLIYDREAKTAIPMAGNFSTEVGTFGAKLFFLYPRTKGWAVIGRADKYLPAAAVKIKSVSDKKITFMLRESGPLIIWSGKGAPKMKGASFKPAGENLYLADLPVKPGVLEVTATR